MCLNMTDTLMNTDSIDNRLKGHVWMTVMLMNMEYDSVNKLKKNG
jgi:hypothetical protein